MNKYPDTWEKGMAFQEYIKAEFAKKGIEIEYYDTEEEQYNIGESKQGYEVKFDGICTTTHRLWIEVAERSSPDKQFVPSGIYRQDNTVWYVIGNPERYFVIPKDTLVALEKSGKYPKCEIATSKGFFLPFKDAADFELRIAGKDKPYANRGV